MRHKIFIICILVIALLSFSLFSCTKQVATTTTSKVAEETTTTTQPSTTVNATTTTEETTTTTQPIVNPLDVPWDGVLWDDDKTTSYFKENVESYLNEKYLIQYNSMVSMMGMLVIDYSSKKDGSTLISKENWEILNELLKFQPSQHAIAFLIKGNDENEYGSYINLFDAKKIIDGNIDYDSWEVSYFFKSGDSSEAESKQKEAIKTMEELIGLADEYKNSTTTTTEETASSTEDAKDNFKKAVIDFIENGYDGKVTKLLISDDLSLITISYNTQWSSKDTVKKEMFDITTVFTAGTSPIEFDLDLSATTQMGDTYHTFTSKENLNKIQDLEMDYTDWLKVAFK